MGTQSRPSAVRRMIAFAMIVPMAVVALLLAPTSATAAEVVKYRLKGTVVSGYSETWDECAVTGTYVTASKDSVYYSVSTYDWCTDQGSYVQGTAEPTIFKATEGASSVHVVATIALSDWETGASEGEVYLDNTWTATTDMIRSKYSYSTTLPGEYRYSTRFNGAFAEATVTGTVPLDSYASVGRYQSLDITVTH